MVGERIMWAIVLWAAGFASAVIVGARNGEQMAQGTADILDTWDEKRAAYLARMVRGEWATALPGWVRARGESNDDGDGWQGGA